MEEWIQLTDDDIARATSLQRVRPPVPEMITVTLDDIQAENAPPAGAIVTSSAGDGTNLTITLEDTRPVITPIHPTADIARLEALMFQLINDTRQNHLARLTGTAWLVRHERLMYIARQHSTDMLRRQYVDHITPEGLTTAQRIQRQHISYMACGENIGVVYGETAHSEQAIYDIHEAFMNQPRSLTNHRANLLNPIWTHAGIGIAVNPDGALVATQLFISAPGRKLAGK